MPNVPKIPTPIYFMVPFLEWPKSFKIFGLFLRYKNCDADLVKFAKFLAVSESLDMNGTKFDFLV